MYYSKQSENWLPNYAALPRTFISAWDRLAREGEEGDPVCCAPIWNLAFQEVFHPDQRLFYLQDGDGIVLLSEFVSQANEIYLTPMEDSWLFGQPLLGSDALDLLGEAVEILSLDYGARQPGIVLSGIREESRQCMALLRRFSKNFNFYRYRSLIQGGASLEGGLEGWLGRRSANHRAKLRKAARKARENGIVFERERPATAAEAALVYSRMLAVEERSWKGIGQCGMTQEPSREFYGALLRRHARGRTGFVIFARKEGRDVGFIFGGSSGAVYRGQQFSYDQQLAHFSLGNLMQLEKVAWLCELGFERYDMGPVTGARMGYKEHWTEEYRRIQAWIMRRK